MPHLILPSLTADSSHFSIDGEQAHHWVRVLRVQVGDNLTILNGKGLRSVGKITSIEKNPSRAWGDIVQHHQIAPPSYRLHLIQGLPKSSKFDFVLEKAVELRASSITPFLSQKNIIHLDEKQREEKHVRWQQVLEAAVIQSGVNFIPELKKTCQFDSLFQSLNHHQLFFLHPSLKKQSLKQQIQGKITKPDVSLVIGPESGFSPEEIKQLEHYGATSISCGDNILRTETAGLVALSLFNYELELF